MLHHSQAMSLDDIYLEDIPHIIHPDTAAGDLADTARPNRIIQEWNLPQSYTRFVSRYKSYHWQHPWMAYRDTLDDIKSGKLVLLRKDLTGHGISGVLTTSGDLRNDLPLFLQTRLRYILSRKLKRPGYQVRHAAPAQHAQAAKTINSKTAGRLLAAGGIYNGNIEGFRQTAQQLGGDAPAGYDQVMDNKGLIIAGTSVAAGLGLGRLGAASELSNLHVLGKVEGEYSMIKPGPLPKELAETFSSGTYKEITLSTDTSFYRGGVEGRPLGQFFGYEQPQGVLQTRIDKALLPKWPNGGESPLDSYHKIQIPAGTKVYVGEVGYQTDIYSGGSEQVLIPTPWKIPGVKILESGGLK
ncbi:hypothetical protein [Enterobacter asburiae]|uniref:hypothetical protein n=1 Tax=Enterobacter asburiae TaxID=61645 RepID=UPI00192C0EC7|nr:hypothetical protein [Enterobacter asburiae]MBL5838569.1 hypothetical protein [Enterobacter asburiae]MBL5939189.1 hypothetical protein [Enterobacter asburiae]MBL5963487.1 hypothetical protein [Enterobacter asburiae]MBL5971650.1 hypothetical protein [Enterobacter asburiae]